MAPSLILLSEIRVNHVGNCHGMDKSIGVGNSRRVINPRVLDNLGMAVSYVQNICLRVKVSMWDFS